MRNLSSAEDFFAYLEVPYDPTVLRVARLHILRRMGEYLDREPFDETPEALARARELLTKAYADFVSASPLSQRVFRVLKERDPSKPKRAKTAFVGLDEIAPLRDEQLSGSRL